jgi:hypothetical protein
MINVTGPGELALVVDEFGLVFLSTLLCHLVRVESRLPKLPRKQPKATRDCDKNVTLDIFVGEEDGEEEHSSAMASEHPVSGFVCHRSSRACRRGLQILRER